MALVASISAFLFGVLTVSQRIFNFFQFGIYHVEKYQIGGFCWFVREETLTATLLRVQLSLTTPFFKCILCTLHVFFVCIVHIAQIVHVVQIVRITQIVHIMHVTFGYLNFVHLQG